MPTYEYYCEENEKNVDVIHSMSEEITTWGEPVSYTHLRAHET